jgi:hypothetical protein
MSLRSILLLPALLLAATVQAGQLLGLVTDQGRPVAGAEITLSGTNGVVAGQAMTDREGQFRLQAPPGNYRLGVFRDDYAPVKRDGIQVGAGDTEVKIEITPAAFVDDQAQPETGCD